jgi:hypothetical protein
MAKIRGLSGQLDCAQAPAVLDHSPNLPQGDGCAGPAFTRRAVGGECNLIVLDAGDVLHDAFAVRGPRIDAESKPSPECGHFRSLPSSVSRGPRLGLLRCVGQALATEAIAECIRNGGVWETESNIELFDLVSTPAAADWDASFTVERINLKENTAKASRRKCEFDKMREVPFVRKADDFALATSLSPNPPPLRASPPQKPGSSF